MKNPRILIALTIILVLIIGIKYDYYDDKEQMEHPAVNEISTLPDQMFRNARHYYLDLAQRRTSIEYVEKAIKAMRVLEKDMDSVGNVMIEKTIIDLESLIVEFEKDEVNVDHMQHAFATALNSLALAQLRVSESYWDQGLEEDARAATRFAMEHVSNAMYFSYSAELKAEQHIVEMITKFTRQEDLSEEEIHQKIHAAILELDQVLAEATVEFEAEEE